MIRKQLFFLLWLCFTGLSVLANDPPYTTILRGAGQVYAGATATVQDSVFFNSSLSSTIQSTNSVQNIISLRLNEFSGEALPDSFRVTVHVDIDYRAINNSGTTYTLTDSVLVINYNKNKTYTAKDFIYFSNAVYASVKITSIQCDYAPLSQVAKFLEVENEIIVDRDYVMQCDASAISSISGSDADINNTGELLVSWVPNRAAEEYDLEWTYIDNTALLAGSYNSNGHLDDTLLFRNNATRVSIKASTYKVPLLYEGDGKLFYRVRCVQYLPTGERTTSRWSSQFPTGLGQYAIIAGHEQNINWQSSVSFAEEGKRKAVVQYSDGALYNRQTVTKDNTTGTTVVAETLYDKQGRPVIQVLPTPTLGSLIKYTARFNTLNTAEYDKDSYDPEARVCDAPAPAMDDANGAAQYYSPSNPLVNNGANKSIPNAYGFAFTETQYANDNTGRIASQGGVGLNHQIGTGHETKYYYGTPSQSELDALFGTEAGIASHYQKNMVRDANGQYSVSYVDMTGKTIATALAGANPQSLAALPSNQIRNRTDALLDGSNNIVRGTVIESVKGLLVPVSGTYAFNYALNPQSLGLTDCKEQTICYDCLYDLEITITDDCNNAKLPGGVPYIVKKNNFSLGGVDTTCTPAPSFSLGFQIQNLPEGSYTITKRLMLSQEKMNDYRDSLFLPHNTCKSYEDIYKEALDSVRKRLGDCTNDSTATPAYQSYREQMLYDLTPPYGQYAHPDPAEGCSLLSVLNVYTHPFNSYKDENGNMDHVVVVRDGAERTVLPEQLTKEEFIDNFKPSWAESLLVFHPEYCLLYKFEKLAVSHVWDEDFEKTEAYADALAKGYLNPLASSNPPASKFTIDHFDPLFNTLAAQGYSIESADARLKLNDFLFNVSPAGQTGISAWGFATMAAKCTETDENQVQSSCTQWTTNTNAFNPNALCVGELDMAWRVFRGLYLDRKQEWIDGFIRSGCGAPSFNYIDPNTPCTPAFPKTEDLLNANGLNFSNITQYQQAQQDGQTQLTTLYDETCRGYATRWYQQLATCNYNPDDSTAIIDQLIAVCKEGSDLSHPLGASSVKPSSIFVNRSFDDVIRTYNQSHSIAYNSNCNGYLITIPKAYEGSSVLAVTQPTYTKPDDCTCSRISQLYGEYNNNAGSYSSFSNYLFVHYHTTVSQTDLDTLMGLCSGAITCKYITHAIKLPAVLQCNSGTCVSCEKVKSLYDQYKTKFPDAIPVLLTQEDEIQEKKNILFENYMNVRLGFQKSYLEYLDFMDSCRLNLGSPALPCDSLSLVYQNFRTLYPQTQAGLQNGQISGGYRITDGAIAMLQAANATLRAKGGQALIDGYGPAPFNNNFTGLLKSVMPFGSNSYQAVLPLPLPYTHSFPELENNTVLPSDFVTGTATPAEQARKYYAVMLANNGLYFHGIWSSQNFGSFAAYGMATPLNKYLAAQYLESNENHIFNLKFFSAPSTVATPQDYNQLYNSIPFAFTQSPYVIPVSDIAWIRNLRFATDFMPSPDPGFSNNARCLKVTLDKINGSTQEGYLWTHPGHDGYIQMKEAVTDATLYNPDCKAAFAAYFNQVFSSSYTYDQLQGLYQSSCGINLQACPSCDTAWTVFNPGNNVSVDENLFANANNNIAPYDQHFDGQHFISPPASGPGHYIVLNKKTVLAANADTALTVKWRIRLTNKRDYVNPVAQTSGATGTNNWVGATWVNEAADTAYMIGTTVLHNVGAINTLSRLGLISNAHGLLADYVKVYNSQHVLIYSEDFTGLCTTGIASSGTLCNNPNTDVVSVEPDGPCADSSFLATIAATDIYRAYKDSLNDLFNNSYTQKCLAAASIESFTVTHQVQEYHYTLYYYDQAGNLIKTIPPEGIDESLYSDTATYFGTVRVARAFRIWYGPNHGLPTTYRYNSLNQVVTQQSPDGGFSQFWYDRLGRLVISQNAKQAEDSNYSYTLYDAIGRITEVGQKHQATPMLQTTSSSPGLLYNWLHNTDGFEQVTRTLYDEIATLPVVSGSTAATFRQKGYTMRNRVSHTLFYKALPVNGNKVPLYNDYTSGSYYSYDIHGNVDTLLQDYRAGVMQAHGLSRYKLLAYRYDLISGKVNEVHYQPGERDQLYHRYEYDGENRITDVFTTFKKEFIGLKNLEDHEAFYQYYKHGPLAKTLLGHQQVQGLDYAYTLQGWLKGVNLDSTLEDAITARDACSFSLHYFGSDYTAINTLQTPTLINAAGNTEFRPLYNGNIGAMAVNIKKLDKPLVYNYGYDQLNRLVSMDAFNGWDPAGNIFAPNKLQDYKERVGYDANGNILTYERNGQGSSSGLLMDKLVYQYERSTAGRLSSNRLRYVLDEVQGNSYTGDIKTGTALSRPQVLIDNSGAQGGDNYGYDAIGNLIKDVKEGITSISWTVYGKIESITKANGITIAYSYDAGGNRISKTVTKDAVATTTWYVRDAQGNVMSVYTVKSNVLTLSEQHLYGSSRLGIWNRSVNMDESIGTPVNAIGIGNVNTSLFDRGNKVYELSNHLGNVLVTVSDKKRGVPLVSNSSLIDYYTADVTTAQDYYPFGMLMPGRRGAVGANGTWMATGSSGSTLPANPSYNSRAGNTPSEYKATQSIEFLPGFESGENDAFEAFITTESSGSGTSNGVASDGSGYRYGFNGKENDDDIEGEGNAYDFGARIYDPRIGRFFSTDPLEDEYEDITPYAFGANNPLYNVDENGEWPKPSELLRKAGIELNPFVAGFVDGLVENSPLGLVSFGWDFAWNNDGVRDQTIAGVQAFIRDPLGSLADIVGSKIDTYKALFNGTTTDEQKYEVGGDLSLLLSGAGIKNAFGKLETSSIRNAERTLQRTAQTVENATKTAEKTAEKAKQGLCFVAGTKVLTQQGLVNIEDVQRGDTIWSYNVITHIAEKRVVSEAIVKEAQKLIVLAAKQDTLLTTPDHPFYVSSDWVEAKNIKVGDSLQLYNRSKVAVSYWREKDTTVTVYNLSVYDLNSYYVGQQSILVHNIGCAQQGPKKAGSGTPRQKAPAQLRKEWEQMHKKEWPKEPNKPNHNQVAHHKKPLAEGGEDHGRNIEPKTAKDHKQHHKDNGDFKRWGKRKGT